MVFPQGIFHGAQFRTSGNSPKVTFQDSIVQASATATCLGVLAADYVAIGGTHIVATQGRATGTVSPSTAIAADTVTINGVTFVGKTGAATLGTLFFSVDTSDTATAASIAAQVNAYKSPLLTGVVSARAASGVCTFYASSTGTWGNAITLASSSNSTLPVSGAALANGAALTNNQFDFEGTDTTTAVDLARAINASTTAAVNQTKATQATTVVTVTALPIGAAGNAITFTSNNGTRLAVTGSGLLASGSAGAPVLWSF